MDYSEAVEYLNSFINYEKLVSFDYREALKLERMKHFADLLGNPQTGLKCIHISGTKGKGSTSAMAASILKEAGFKVGLYTSPHLVSFRERIKINGESIKEEELCALINRIKPFLDSINKDSDDYPTFFEVYTTLAFLHFKKNNVDFCVLEVGMGGRLDATNIASPLCCGITPISLEHTQKLGNTVGEIAHEKAGIIKENSTCVSSYQDGPAMEVIERICAQKKARLYKVGTDLSFKQLDYGTAGQQFLISGIFEKYPKLEISLLGDHQLANAATAIGLVESLRFYDIIIGYNPIREGLRKTEWPGRLQILQRSPYIVLDGAQNSSSAKALKLSLRKFFKYDKLILVVGISRDKDITGICEELEPISNEIILTKANIPRAAEPQTLKRYMTREVRSSGSVAEAMKMAKDLAGPSDLILVTGSLFVVGEALSSK